MPKHPPTVLVLGIGNLLWADEGFGVRAAEEMYRHYEFDENVRIMDGGTQGVYLIQHILETDILIVFDAIDYGLAPGTLKRIEGNDVPKFLGIRKISLHQTGFQEVLAMAEMLGGYPEHLLLVGVQPDELEDYGGSLRPAVKAQIGPAIQNALDYLARLGVQAKKRNVVLPEEATIIGPEMTLGRYEAERPTESRAFRHGDSRILTTGSWTGPEDFDQEMAILVSTCPEAS